MKKKWLFNKFKIYVLLHGNKIIHPCLQCKLRSHIQRYECIKIAAKYTVFANWMGSELHSEINIKNISLTDNKQRRFCVAFMLKKYHVVV